MKFTDRKLAGLKPKSYPYDLREQDGFAVCVYPSGSVSFVFIYDWHGKRKRLVIGPYPKAYSLAEAREKHREMYKAYKQGTDPARVADDGLTVKTLAEKFLGEYVARQNTVRTLKNREGQFANHVYPLIGHRAANSIKRADIFACLKKYADAKEATGHNHLLGTLKKMFNWAILQELVEHNPAHLIKNMPTQEKSRTLTDKELRQVWEDGDSDSGKILKLIMITGCRPGEAVNLSHADIDGRWWTCLQKKGGRISRKRSYLPCTARSLLPPATGMAFPSMNTQNGPAKYVLRKYGKGWTPHDIRRTVATRLAGLGYSDEWIGRFLGHSVGKLSRTYNVHSYDREIREMTVVWNRALVRIVKKKATA